MINKIIFLLGLIMAFFFHSCVNLEQEKTVIADAFITSKIINGDTLFAIEAYVRSNATMDEVTFELPDKSKKLELINVNNVGSLYEYIAPNNDFSATRPTKGNYTFQIEFSDNTSQNLTDNVSDSVLLPITIKEIKPDLVEKNVFIDWAKVSGANYYIIRIEKSDTIVFISDLIHADYSSAKINANTVGWVNNYLPKSGDQLNVYLSSLMKESGTTEFLEVQAISYSEIKPVAWP
jgi:hypothetical protein